jgi:hypothetical protein
MGEWTSEQASILEGGWAPGRKKDDLTLAGSDCPNCWHPKAFMDVIIGTAPIGSQGLDVDTDTTAPEYPESTLVACSCGMHDHSGCGKEGLIRVIPP